MTSSGIKQIWKNEYFQTVITIIAIIAIVLALWYGSQLALNTQYPALAVATGSMCKPYRSACDGWTHPFEQTLHVGDLIIVQGVDPGEIKAAPYPDGDIIVFRKFIGSELIVHRAVNKTWNDGDQKWEFQTWGDGNPSPDRDPIPEEHVIGKVILRIPWAGQVALFMRNSSGVYIILFLIIIIVVIEFILPLFTGKKIPEKEEAEEASEN